MKTITTMKWTAVWILAASLTAHAQGIGSGSETSLGGSPGGSHSGGTPSGGNQAGEPGMQHQHQRPSPEQVAAQLMSKFDANKDGELDQGELAQALEALRAHHQQHGVRGGGHGGGSSNSWHHASSGAQPGGSGAQAQHRTPPSADQVAAHLIKKFSADGKGLTEAELAKVIEARRARHAQRKGQGGSGQNGTGGGLHSNGPSSGATTTGSSQP